MKKLSLVATETFFEFAIMNTREYKIEFWVVFRNKGRAFCFLKRKNGSSNGDRGSDSNRTQ